MGDPRSDCVCSHDHAVMPSYRNKNTGMVLTVPCVLSGEVWEEVKDASKPEETKPEKAVNKPKSAKKK